MELKKEHLIIGLFLVAIVIFVFIFTLIKTPGKNVCGTNENCESKQTSTTIENLGGPENTCQTNADCPENNECSNGACWGPE